MVYGNKLQEDEINSWRAKLPNYGLENTSLIVQQGVDHSDLRNEVKNLTDLYAQNQKIISSRDESIKEKEDRINLLESELQQIYSGRIPFVQLSEEVKINYSGLKELSYAKLISTNFNSVDTLTVFKTYWYDSIPNKSSQILQLEKWLKVRLKLDKIKVTSSE